MVNFRFHLVSIIAIFLALAVGIGMGVTVIDKATVDFLKRRLDTVSDNVTAAERRNNDLQRQIGRDNSYEGRADDYLVDKRLSDTPVVVIAVRGIDGDPVNEMRKELAKAGATTYGTLWFTAKDTLSDTTDAVAVQQLLGAESADASALRQVLVTRVAAVMAGSNDGSALKELVSGGYLDWEADRAPGDIAKVTFGGSRVVVASAFNASVPNDQLATPLVRLLAAQPVKRTVAVESGREPDDRTSGERAVFLQPLRSDGSLNGKLSTVDDIEVPSGRVATVLALAQLASGRTGHYGLGSSVDGPIPKLNP